MRKSLFVLTLLISSVIAYAGPGGKYTADASNSTIEWKAKKVTGAHNGTVNLKRGGLEFTDGALTGGMFEIDMTSIVCTDLKGDMKGKLEGHLKSADFFDVENHNTATLKITSVAAAGTPGDYKVTADLTIKGITKPVKFYTNVNTEAGTASAEIEVDRTEYDVKYGSSTFFGNLGDRTIYDEFKMKVNLSIKEG